jgi:serine/threonine-protein kinase
VNRAVADADMVAELEQIRLRISALPINDDADSRAFETLYADAFRKYGIPVSMLEPADAAARIRASSIRDTLLANLHQWLRLVPDENRKHFLDVLDQADDDDWRHAFREALLDRDADTLKALANAPQTKDQAPVVLSVLGGALLTDKHSNAAMALLQKGQQRYPGDFWLNYLLGLYWNRERPREAVGFFRVAVAIRPTNDQAYMMLARALRDSEDADAAIAAFRHSIELNPNFPAAKDLIVILVQRGKLEDARAAWEKYLEREPPDHEPWYGYAELCLFLGKIDEYRRARRALLERFGTTSNPFDAERTARACLLLPATEVELRLSVDLAQRAVAERAGDKWGHPYFEFVHGLAEYRQGQFDQAITTMRGDASTVLGPAPGLVLAMALHRSGDAAESRKVLAKTILAHDWRAIPFSVLDPSGWVYHILRREGETLIVPNLQVFLDGKYEPQDNDERLALLGTCQFMNRTRAMARLYAGAFAADPSLTKDSAAGHCYNAARVAALAGCGQGADATDLADEEKARLRDQARQWLRADLAARSSAFDTGSTATRGAVRLALTRWQNEPDLAGLREQGELNKLPADERKECLALWQELTRLLAPIQK